MKLLAFATSLSLLTANFAFSTTIPKALVGIEYYDPLQHSHVIVRGVVLASKSTSRQEAGWTFPGAPSNVTTIQVRVNNLLKGKRFENELELAAYGSIAPLFEIGGEYIFCAKLRTVNDREALVTGTWIGIYQRGGERWNRVVLDDVVERRETLTDDQVRARLKAAQLNDIAQTSDVIARGTIERMWETSYAVDSGKLGRLTHVRLRAIEVLRGSASSDVVEFVIAQVRGAGYVPDWYRITPAGMKEGQMWLVFLRRGDHGLYPFGGPNSLLQLDGDKLIYDNAVEYPNNIKEALAAIREEVGRAR